MAFSHASRERLTAHDLNRFPGPTLFARLARAVCAAACLPRKELFEAWEVARRVRRTCRGGRIVDLGGGHGLLAQVMLLLDDSSPSSVVVDTKIPPSAAILHQALVSEWPRLADRTLYQQQSLHDFPLLATDVVVSSHACGRLTDVVIERAVAAGASVAVLPCCHHFDASGRHVLGGWIEGALAIDVMRAVRLDALGYRVRTQTIPADITMKNRLLIGTPRG